MPRDPAPPDITTAAPVLHHFPGHDLDSIASQKLSFIS
jgi:hypothetical protein